MKFEEVSQETLQNIDGGRILIDAGKLMTLSLFGKGGSSTHTSSSGQIHGGSGGKF